MVKFDFNKIVRLGKILEYFWLYVLDLDEYDKNYMDLFFINFEKGAFKFIANLDNNKINTLKELIDKSEDKLVTYNDIQEMIKCSDFIKNLGKIQGIKKTQDLIKEFINEIQRKKDIVDNFKNYSNCFGNIRELFAKK